MNVGYAFGCFAMRDKLMGIACFGSIRLSAHCPIMHSMLIVSCVQFCVYAGQRSTPTPLIELVSDVWPLVLSGLTCRTKQHKQHTKSVTLKYWLTTKVTIVSAHRRTTNTHIHTKKNSKHLPTIGTRCQQRWGCAHTRAATTVSPSVCRLHILTYGCTCVLCWAPMRRSASSYDARAFRHTHIPT